MKNYPFLEAIGTADDRFLEEVFDDNEHERRRIYMSKKKLTAIIAVAAAITMLLSVSVVAAATFTGLTDGNSAIGSAMTYVVRNAETKEEGDMLANYILAGLSYDAIFEEQQANFGFSGLRPVYHVSFKVGGYTYDVDVDAKTGVVISCDREIDEGWDEYLENETHGVSVGGRKLPEGYYSGIERVLPEPDVEYDMGNISPVDSFLIAETYFGLNINQGDNCIWEGGYKESGPNYATSPITHVVQLLHAGYVYECSIDSITGEVTELFVGEDPEYSGDNVHKHTKSDEYIGSYEAALIAREEMGLDPDVTPYPSFCAEDTEYTSEGEVTYHDVYWCAYNKFDGDSQTLTTLIIDAKTGEVLLKLVAESIGTGASQNMQVPSADAPDGMISEAEAQIVVLEDLGIIDIDIKGFTIELKESETPNESYYEINLVDKADNSYTYKVNAVSGQIIR